LTPFPAIAASTGSLLVVSASKVASRQLLKISNRVNQFGEVLVRTLDQPDVAELALVAEEGELDPRCGRGFVPARARAAGGLAEQVERDVGERRLLLELWHVGLHCCNRWL